MADRTNYPQEGWDVLAVVEAFAPGPDFAPMTSREIVDCAGVPADGTNRHWAIYDLRQRGLIEAPVPVNSGRKVREIRLTSLGKDVLDIYREEGEAAGIRALPECPGKRRGGARTRRVTPLSRPQALEQAREVLGTDAPIADLLEAAKFFLEGGS